MSIVAVAKSRGDPSRSTVVARLADGAHQENPQFTQVEILGFGERAIEEVAWDG